MNPIMNHPISIGAGHKVKSSQTETVPWGDTITVPFGTDADLIYTQTPMFPPAFLPLVPGGHFYSGDVIGPRTAQRVTATVTLYFRLAVTGETGSIVIEVLEK